MTSKFRSVAMFDLQTVFHFRYFTFYKNNILTRTYFSMMYYYTSFKGFGFRCLSIHNFEVRRLATKCKGKKGKVVPVLNELSTMPRRHVGE
jgi:hypothetical protein